MAALQHIKDADLDTTTLKLMTNRGSGMTQALVINSSGNVGIGTDSPISELSVHGKISITNETETPDAPSDGNGYIYTKSDGKLYWRSADLAETDLTGTGTVNASSGTFSTLSLGAGSITDSSGAISFGNENLSTTGTLNFLADSSAITFGEDSEITLTHVADQGLTLKHTATGDDTPVILTLATGETDIGANDVIGTINFQAPDEVTGTDAVLVAAGIEAVSEGDFAADNNATKLSFKTAASEAATEKMSLSSTGNLTISGDLAVTGGDISYGNGQNATLTVATTDSGTDGRDLTISAGSAPTGATNQNGGDLILSSGGGDGTGTSNIQFKTKINGTDAVSERMRIDTNGNLGIGTTVAQEKLTVAGRIAITAESGPPVVIQDGAGVLYTKSDGKIYWRSFDVEETDLTSVAVSQVTVSANTNDETVYLTFVDGATGTQDIETHTGLNYNPSSGVLTTGGINSTGDMTIYDDQDDADTSLSIGTSATEALIIQVLNGGSNKTAEEIKFKTKTASSTGDHGKMTFSVDEIDILEINDGGISYSNGQDATLTVATTDSGTDGRDLTISAGSAPTGATNQNGGDLILKSGFGDGTGSSIIGFHTSTATSDDAVAERMRIHTNGNVGIGTTTPIKKLHLKYDEAPTGNPFDECLFVNNVNSTTNSKSIILFGQDESTGNRAEIFFNYDGDNSDNNNISFGFYGISDRVNIYKSLTVSGNYYFTHTDGLIHYSTSFGYIGLRSAAAISSPFFVAHSDSRIKKEIVEIDDDECLVKIRELKPCKYKYIDEISKGSDVVYGFIAQEVRAVLPYAVTEKALPEAIPNIYKGGVFTDGTIVLPEAHGLTENGNIKLKIKINAIDIVCPYTIVNETTLNIDTTNLSGDNLPSNDPMYDEDGNELPYNIFVYGTEVDDFHVIRKDAIWTTGISALQEVDRQLQAEKAKTATLESQVADLLARVTALENP